MPKSDEPSKEKATRAFILFIFLLYWPVILVAIVTAPFVALKNLVLRPFRKSK